jgi:hypothetical protein
VIAQRDMRLHGYETIAEALDAHADVIEPNEAIQMLSYCGELYELNSVGALLWEMLTSPRTTDELCRRLQDEFDISAAEALSDVGQFVRELEERGIISEVAV